MENFQYRDYIFINLKYLKYDTLQSIVEFCEKIISIIKNSPNAISNHNLYKEYLLNNIELTYNENNKTITLNEIIFDKKNPFIYIKSTSKIIQLNKEQYAAIVDNSKYSMIVACPGSGKTRTLTSKIIYLLDKYNNPNEFFITTFTNKAAKEMMDRIKQYININIYEMNLGTFHGMAWRVLKKHNTINYEIIEEDEQVSIISHIIKEKNFEKLAKITPRNLLRIISIYKNNCMKKDIMSIAKKYLRELEIDEDAFDIGLVYKEYEKRKKRNCQYDFDDILLEFAKFLSSDIGNLWRMRIKYLFIDEFQDTNPLQDLIMENFVHEKLNITVVGDENQSIYGFRGSDVKLFWNFRNLYEPKVFYLKTNYRNPNFVINALNELIKNSKPIVGIKNENNQKIKYNIFKNTTNEAEYIYNSIVSTKSLYNCNYKDIAVLSRTRKYWETLEMVLLKNKIPYKISGGQSIFEKAHIKDFIAILRFHLYPKNTNVWKRITAITPGIGKMTYDRIIDTMSKYEMDMVRKLINLRQNFPIKVFEKLSYLIKVGKLVENGHNMSEIIGGILGIILPILESFYKKDFDKRKGELLDFGNMICRFGSLEEFFEDMMLNETLENDEVMDFVNITTIHHSKGLEWPHIFIIGCREQINDDELQKEEERRIFYVALSRAIKTCEITFAKYGNFGGMSYEQLSFIDEMEKSISIEIRDIFQKTNKKTIKTMLNNNQDNQDNHDNHNNNNLNSDIWDNVEIKSTNIVKNSLEGNIYKNYEGRGNFIDLLLKRMIVDYAEVEINWYKDSYVSNLDGAESNNEWTEYYDYGSDNYLQKLVGHFKLPIIKDEIRNLILYLTEQIAKMTNVFFNDSFSINEKVNYKNINGELDLCGNNWIIDIKTNMDGNIYKNDIKQLFMYEYSMALKDKIRRRLFLWFPLTNQLKEIIILNDANIIGNLNENL
jgi:DNA helicase II / ATP-dependent DNA helicase PcrA